ncbi:MAG: FKBP-type peptidyl-prolyl cis-trans isomerase, partial [Bacteroidales bacterium]|nr:FKBP-type peptidyl-prolyl cis-trans isomerase [Bacteroidales bacterium]
YTLKLKDKTGKIIQKVDKEKPFVYLFGVGGLLPVFESNLKGLDVGNSFEFSLRKEDGYGEYNNDMIIELGKDVFKVEDKIDEEMLKIGNIVPMQNDQGRQLNGKIISVSDDKVKMDFNHPLAGEDLYFEGVILEIREATKEELEQKQAQ